jgi:hypothetical protein
MQPSVPPPRQQQEDAPLEAYPARLRPYRTIIAFAVGSVATYWGRHFTYTFLFTQVVRVSSWRALRRVLLELRNSYRATSSALNEEFSGLCDAQCASADAVRRLGIVRVAYAYAQSSNDYEAMHELATEMAELQHDVARASSARSSIGRVFAALDPDKLAQLGRGVLEALATLTAAATSNGAAKVGVGINIGGTMATTINGAALPFLRRRLETFARHFPSLGLLLGDEHARRWVELLLSAACNSVGVGLAFYFEKLVFVVSNALWGAELMAMSAHRMLVARGAGAGLPALHGVRLGLASSGVYFQFFGAGRALPPAMRLVLFPPLLTERWLQSVALAVRGLG